MEAQLAVSVAAILPKRPHVLAGLRLSWVGQQSAVGEPLRVWHFQMIRSASEDFFAPVRAMLVNPRNAGPQALRDPAVRARSQAAAEVIGWQRRTLLEPLKAARTEPFNIRRLEKSDGE